MKKLLVFAFLFAIVFTTVNTVNGQENKDVTGEWKYEVPTAPTGYDKGVLVITEKEDKLAGEVKFADGYKIELKNLIFEEGVFKCGLYVDYEYVSVTVSIEGNKMTGSVDTPEGEMKITAEKIN